MEQIAPYVQIILTVVVGCFILYQNRVLKTQVKTQGEMMTNIKSFMDIISLNRLKEYGEILEKTGDNKVILAEQEFEKKLREQMDIQKANKEQYEKSTVELNTVVYEYLINYHTYDKRREIIDTKLPSNRETLYELLEGFEKSSEEAKTVFWTAKKLKAWNKMELQHVLPLTYMTSPEHQKAIQELADRFALDMKD